MRDIILGHTPPATLADWRYLAVAGLAGLLVFTRYARVVHHSRFITGFDAVGLSIFTVTGTTIAVDSGLSPAPAVLLGMLTGVGGGVVRDVLAAEVPLIFRSEIYAVASMLGAIIIILASQSGLAGIPAEVVGAIATFSLRMVSVQRGWRIPIARPRQEMRRSSALMKPALLASRTFSTKANTFRRFGYVDRWS